SVPPDGVAVAPTPETTAPLRLPMSPKHYGRTSCGTFRTTWKLHWIVYGHTEQNPVCPSRCTQPWEGFTCLGAKGVNSPEQAYPFPALHQVRGMGRHPKARDGSTFRLVRCPMRRTRGAGGTRDRRDLPGLAG